MVSRLFQPFMQLDTTLDRSKGGLGLGLALVRALAELHGGEVRAESAGSGQGSEFTVRLPLDDGPVSPEKTAEERQPSRSRRVLIIEDNADAADTLRQVLELGAHEVSVAVTGSDWLDIAREFCPEVVFCDIGLPGMNGFEVARAFRADDKLRNTHLIALSGYASSEDLQQASEAGFDDHLAKPASPERLEQLLASLPTLGRSPASDSNRTHRR